MNVDVARLHLLEEGAYDWKPGADGFEVRDREDALREGHVEFLGEFGDHSAAILLAEHAVHGFEPIVGHVHRDDGLVCVSSDSFRSAQVRSTSRAAESFDDLFVRRLDEQNTDMHLQLAIEGRDALSRSTTAWNPSAVGGSCHLGLLTTLRAFVSTQERLVEFNQLHLPLSQLSASKGLTYVEQLQHIDRVVSVLRMQDDELG